MGLRKSGIVPACALIAVGLAAGACTEKSLELWNEPHVAEGEGLGDTSRHVMAQQIVDPEPVNPTPEEAAADGARTQKAVTDYKAREVTITKSGGGGGGAGGGSAVTAAAPAK